MHQLIVSSSSTVNSKFMQKDAGKSCVMLLQSETHGEASNMSADVVSMLSSRKSIYNYLKQKRAA